MNDKYKTIEDCSEGFFSDKGSKFLAFAYPVKKEGEIKQIINDVKKKYHDARHHVYAYIIGYNQESFRANDDGEPTNSSGMPLLGQIRSFGLTNVLIIVVRYFGGTKLGIPGLINAYKSAAKDAIENAKIVDKTIMQGFIISFDYPEMNFVMKLIKDFKAEIKMQDFKENCKIILEISISLHEDLFKALSQNTKIKIEDFNE
ncbi:MAG TPA: YigZ family protein [Bacteroidales bacterium]|nr:YigZ family protein [Bacteroidales bacterium]